MTDVNPATQLESVEGTGVVAVAPLRLEFAGEWHDLPTDRPFIIGREGDLEIDDNPYLHRHFLELRHRDGLWWIANVGVRLAATISSAGGSRAVLALTGSADAARLREQRHRVHRRPRDV